MFLTSDWFWQIRSSNKTVHERSCRLCICFLSAGAVKHRCLSCSGLTPAWTWWSPALGCCRLWPWIPVPAATTRCCTPRRTWERPSSISWSAGRPPSASSAMRRSFSGSHVQLQSTLVRRQGRPTPHTSLTLDFFRFIFNAFVYLVPAVRGRKCGSYWSEARHLPRTDGTPEYLYLHPNCLQVKVFLTWRRI